MKVTKPNRKLEAHEAAVLLVYNARKYQEERGKEVSRLRFSLTTLQQLTSRKRISDEFIVDLQLALEELNWSMCEVGGKPDKSGIIQSTDEFGMIQSKKLEAWPKLSIERVAEYLPQGEEAIAKLYDELTATSMVAAATGKRRAATPDEDAEDA